MANPRLLCQKRNIARGQSLVETALFLPLLLFLLAGALEISNILITQNRVQTAARAGTGFGATNYNPTHIDQTFVAMSNVALNNVKDTVELAENRWDIYTVKATINTTSQGYVAEPESESFPWDNYAHPAGSEEEPVFSEEEWNAAKMTIARDILCATLNLEGVQQEECAVRDELVPSSPQADDEIIEVIATITYHKRRSFLGLGYFNPGFTRIRGLTVMRISNTVGTNDGCDLFPITLHVNNLSLFPENFAGELNPEAGEKRFVSSHYLQNNTYIIRPYAYNDNPFNHEGFPLAEGGNALDPYTNLPNRGDIFEVREVSGPGGFGWLSWNNHPSAAQLARSLTPPGTLTLEPLPPGDRSGLINYKNPDDPNDLVPSIGDWIATGTGNMNNVTGILDDHIISERQIQIVVFDEVRDRGNNLHYHIVGFAQVYLRGRHTVGQDKRLLVEFIRWAEPCFMQAPEPNDS